MTSFLLRSTRIAIDFAVLSLAYWLAFIVRFDGLPPDLLLKRLVFTWPYAVAFQYAVLSAFGVPRFVWRYAGLREAGRAVQALLVSSLVLLMVRLGAASLTPTWGYAQYALVPTGVILVNLMLAFLGITGARALRRLLAERSATQSLRRPSAERIPTILIGAGQAGVLVAKEIGNRPDLGIHAVGFLDDDPAKKGAVIHGVPVLGSIDKLPDVARTLGAKQVLITIASAPGSDIRRIVSQCEKIALPIKIIPGIFEILDGRVNLSRIRTVRIEDLLGREPVSLDADLIKTFLQGKRVLVTGAGGSIGSELCRQVARFNPSVLVLVERAEYALFTIHRELIQAFPHLRIEPRICDVCDTKRLEKVFSEDRPHVVFHAAAHKHVPMMEWNPGEALKNNVFGTKKVADAADRFGADAFVLISTDKAVNPTSIMGASKRVAEMYVQSLGQRSKTKYVAVRFGNVLGSTGSVIPIFEAQIALGGPVMVTHPDMKRYFMTIPEASQLVMEAAAMGNGGEIFVLDMGEAVKIVDLARDLIRLSGFEPDHDIRIEFSGLRPGEKLFEELGFDAEKMSQTRHPKIYIGNLSAHSHDAVTAHLESLAPITSSSHHAQVRAALHAVVPEMTEDASHVPPTVRPKPEAVVNERVRISSPSIVPT